MHFEPNDEQVALRDTLARLLADQHDHETRRRIAASAPGASDALWQRLIDLGLTALPVPEAQGGLGGRGEDLLVALQEIGRSLLASPLLGSCIVPDGGAEAALAWRAGLPACWRPWPAASSWPGPTTNPTATAARAGWPRGRAATATAWRLDGAKAAVHHGHSAARFLVSARHGGRSPATPTGARCSWSSPARRACRPARCG
jgi:pimeloyl-CoA dehydrogenase